MLKRKNVPFLIIIIILFAAQIPLILPFFHSGFFPTHDDVQVVRIFEMFQSVRFGDFPPRWSSGLLFGYGYPLFNFYAPLTYLIGAIFVLFGANFLIATKAVFIVAFFIGAIGMFYLVREWMGEIPAFIGSLVFSLVPYRALEVYVRGSLAEFFAYSLFPWVLWANLKIFQTKSKPLWLPIFSILLALLIITHSISGFIFSSFLLLFNIFYLLWLKKDDKGRDFLNFLKGVAVAVGLSSFYWIPLVYEMKFVRLSQLTDYPYYNFFVPLNQIWESSWGFGGFHGNNPMSLQLGKVIIIGSILSLFLNVLVRNRLRALMFFLGAVMSGSIFLELKFSSFIWENISFLPLIQFPWRYHILITICGSILVGYLLYVFQQSKLYKRVFGRYLLTILTLVIVFAAFKESVNFFSPKTYYEGTFVAESTTWDDEYLPNWVKSKPKDFAQAQEKIKILDGQGAIKDIEWGYLNKNFTAEITTDSTIRIAHIYYPGWIARVNDQATEIFYDNPGGLMTIKLPKGMSKVTINFERTWWRTISESISLLCFFYIVRSFLKVNTKPREG